MYQRILVPIDGSPTSQRGLEEGIQLAKLTNGRLRLLHVVDELSFALGATAYSSGSGEWLDALREGGAAILKQAAERVRAEGLEVDTVLVDNFRGPLADVAAAEASNWPADLIVLGTHGRRGVGRLVMGSGAEQILRRAPVPVLLVREKEAADVPPATARPNTGGGF